MDVFLSFMLGITVLFMSQAPGFSAVDEAPLLSSCSVRTEDSAARMYFTVLMVQTDYCSQAQSGNDQRPTALKR